LFGVFEDTDGRSFAVVATLFAIVLSEGKTPEEINIMANVYGAIASSLSLIRSLMPTPGKNGGATVQPSPGSSGDALTGGTT
jgi:hypothetical protein